MAQPLRREVERLALRADRDLASLWRSVESAAQAHTALADVLPALVTQYGAAAATLAATWYDDLRAKQDVKGRFTAIPADLGTAGADALAGYGAAAVARHDGLTAAAQVLVSGGLQRRIAGYARQTVMDSSIADPGARGWHRTGAGECDFCSMLIGRGAVYTSSTVDFEAHDHCKCQSEPAWR